MPLACHVIEPLARQVAAAVESLRQLNLYKPPGVAETIDWAKPSPRSEPPTRRALGRRHARHGLEVPRGPGAGPPARADRRPRPAAPRTRAGVRRPASASRAAIAVGFARVRVAPGVTSRSARDHLRRGAGPCRPRRPRAAYWAGRATLVHHPEDITSTTGPSPCSGSGATVPTAGDASRRSSGSRWRSTTRTPPTRADGEHDDRRRPQLVLRFSAAEVLRHKDFADYDDDELRLAQQLMTRLPPRRAARVSFRMSPSRRRPRPDLRRTMRHPALRAGRADPPGVARAGRPPAPARPAPRHQRVDGAVRQGDAALRAGRRRRAPAGRGVRPRHPPHRATDPRARRAAIRTAALRRAGDAGRGLERWHPSRRVPAHVQRPVGHRVAWPAARSSSSSATAGTAATRRCCPSRWSACSAWSTR